MNKTGQEKWIKFLDIPVAKVSVSELKSGEATTFSLMLRWWVEESSGW